MKKNKKTSNSNLKLVRDANKQSSYEKVRLALSWRKRTLNKDQIMELCSDMYEWALQPTSVSIADFYNAWGIPRATFYELLKKSEELTYVHGLVKEIIGSRLHKLAMYKDNECNEKTIHRTLHCYHPDWKEVFDAEVALKRELSKDEVKKKPTHITVVMDDFGSKHSDKDKA